MKTPPTPSPLPPLICRCHMPTGKRGHQAACIRTRRRAEREQRALLVVHTYLHKKRGADIQLELPAHQPLTPAQRQLLEDRFELLEITGWLLPGGVQAIARRQCRWKKVPPAIVDHFLGDLSRLLWPQSAPNRSRRHDGPSLY